MKTIAFDEKRLDAIVAEVASALAKGPVAVPMLGGACVLSCDAGWLRRCFGAAFRLTTDAESGLQHEDTKTQSPQTPETEPNHRDTETQTSPESKTQNPKSRVQTPGSGILSLVPHASHLLQRLMSLPVVLRLAGQEDWDGIAPANEELIRKVLARVSSGSSPNARVHGPESLFVGVAEDEESEELVQLLVRGPEGPGPTVLDLRQSPAVVDRKGSLGILELERIMGEHVRLGPGIVFSVLVVCTGNMCRSPMAAGLLDKRLAGAQAFVYSAGTGAPVGSTATKTAVEAVKQYGVDLSRHRAQALTRELVAGADLILTMEEHHRQAVLELNPLAEPKTRLLLEYAAKGEQRIASSLEVPDPVGRPIETYLETIRLMQPALERVAEEIESRR